ncbi:MAG: L-serine ammonia-lyase, iron-sulfur-dependent, subunit alpha [Bacteroidales bacterium]|jgi:L-cysteine desulfidase|nr:L-serine ammonia-lyase, iron-sulfur-dependent, subunit alpha [Bacteroidales bacterium]
MTSVERKQIIALINREVVPAIGCTEPIAVSLAAAKLKEVLGEIPEKITVLLSANVLKNAMGVGIPGTGMIGLPIAIALGVLAGKTEYQLEVLKDISDKDVEKGKQYIAEKRINVALKQGISEKLYIEVFGNYNTETAKVIIAGEHTNFTYIAKGQQVLLNKTYSSNENKQEEKVNLSLTKVYEFATTSPLEEIRFILKSAELNKAAAEQSFTEEYGHQLGKLLRDKKNKEIIGDNLYSSILCYTSAACDARMAGAKIPVMTNSGSGNQGISATLPIVIYAEQQKKTEEDLIRALILSHLTVIYIKQHMGRLSALCGCVVAATGSSCGITYLMGGNYNNIVYAVKNMIANITGMICDGAKPSCSLKVTTGVSTAFLSAMMAMENKCVSSLEGIIEDDVNNCIRNLTLIGTKGMELTDQLVLNIMTKK